MILQQTTSTIIYMQAKAKYDTKKQVITKRKVTVNLRLIDKVVNGVKESAKGDETIEGW